MCHLCAWNVPVVCTYFMVRKTEKYGPLRFQRRVARVSTTKTRFCGSIRDLVIFIEFLSFVPTAQHLNPSAKKISNTARQQVFRFFILKQGQGLFSATFSLVTFPAEMSEYVRRKRICCLRIGLIYCDKDSVSKGNNVGEPQN